MAKCKSCGAPIRWIRTVDNKWMPCNERLIAYKQGEDPDYEDYVVTDQGEVIRCTFDFQCEPTGVAHIPHWATCPNRKDYKR